MVPFSQTKNLEYLRSTRLAFTATPPPLLGLRGRHANEIHRVWRHGVVQTVPKHDYVRSDTVTKLPEIRELMFCRVTDASGVKNGVLVVKQILKNRGGSLVHLDARGEQNRISQQQKTRATIIDQLRPNEMVRIDLHVDATYVAAVSRAVNIQKLIIA
jgi:hypothetical protein